MAVEVYKPNSPAVSAAASAALAKIKGRQKAAVLLVSIGTERAAQVFARLRDEEIETLSLEMAKLQFLEPGVADGVIGEIAATVQAYDSLNAGGVEYAREVLERALGTERAAEIIGRLSSVIEKRPFEFLRRTPPEQVVTFLRNESPQTTALVDRQPAHHARRPGAVQPARGRAARDRAADRPDGGDQPGRRQAGRDR